METRVLVVEDEYLVAQMIVDVLKEQDCIVDVARSGMDAITAIIEHPPYTVVITDIMLPDVDGFAVMKTIVRNSPHTYVIIYSGRDVGLLQKDLQQFFDETSRVGLPRLKGHIFPKGRPGFVETLLKLVAFLQKVETLTTS